MGSLPVLRFLIKALASQSQASLLLATLVLLIWLGLSQLETLVPAFTLESRAPGFLERPALAFLLLNCVIVTIAAISKFGNDQEESKGEAFMKHAYGEGNQTWGTLAAAESFANVVRKTYGFDTRLENVCDYQDAECSLVKCGPFYDGRAERSYVNEKRFSRKARLPSRRGLHETNVKLLLRADQRGRDKGCDLRGELRRNVHQSQSATSTGAQPPSAAAPPPLDTPSAEISHDCISFASAAAETYPQEAVNVTPSLSTKSPSAPHTAAAEKPVERDGANNQVVDVELEELNRRADALIARFHRQMRLQRQEPLFRWICATAR